MSKASLKTFAHALTLAQSARRLSVTSKPGFYIDVAVTESGKGKSFTLTCGSEVSQCTVPANADPRGPVTRSMADQLVEILATKSGASAQDMAMGDAKSARAELVLTAVTSKRASK
jgi:hypothetical protein